MLELVQSTLVLTALAALFALTFKRWPSFSKFGSFSLLGIAGIASTIAGLHALLTHASISFQIHSGFPNVIFEFKFDPLAGFFWALIGIVVAGVAIYAPSYMRSYEQHGRTTTTLTFFTALFIASMYMLVLASDAFSFLLFWELMSISSYFLVSFHHEHAANRHAAFIYILMAHASGLLIFLSYSVLMKFGSGYSFAAFQAASLSPAWATCAFLLALLGFGMKAGIIPLHVWLPEAHPAAPSHISALMSGVMLKVAIYGLLRFCFSILHPLHWQWGVLILFIGVISAVLGVLYALMQHDLKKLLAYSSVENIGIIFIGIGLAVIFISTGHPILGSLGLVAALYHCLNHAVFKALLFLGAGAVVQHAHEQNLENMGGLIHKMPYTALFFLIGCISISALPPFNGFVSEWLTFQAALQATTLTSGILRTLLPVTAALLALTGALAAACFVKVYGVAFLGQARTEHVRKANDPAFGMRASMGLLAILCLFFGIFPVFVINIINAIPQQLLGSGLTSGHHWLWLVPISSSTSSYSAPIVFISLMFIAGFCYWALQLQHRQRYWQITKVKPWECGFGAINERMQYSAAAFAMPFRRVFKGVWSVNEKITQTGDKNVSGTLINYSLQISDWIWTHAFAPLERVIAACAKLFARLQGGNVRVYLAYTFFVLIVLLWVASW